MGMRDSYQNPLWKRFNLTINPHALLDYVDCDIERVNDALRAHWSAFMVMEIFGEMPYFSALKLFDAVCMEIDKRVIEKAVKADITEMKRIGLI